MQTNTRCESQFTVNILSHNEKTKAIMTNYCCVSALVYVHARSGGLCFGKTHKCLITLPLLAILAGLFFYICTFRPQRGCRPGSLLNDSW